MRLEEIGARIVETGSQQRSAEGHTDRIPNATVQRCHLHPLKSTDVVDWLLGDSQKEYHDFFPVSYQCPESSCLLRLCFTHLPHCQALVHAPGKFQERTFSYALGLGLRDLRNALIGHQTIPMVKPFKNNGSESRSPYTHLRPNHSFTDTMPRSRALP